MRKIMIRKPKIYERMGEASFTPGAGLALLIAFGLYILYYLIREIFANIIDLIYYSGHSATNQSEAEKMVRDYITAPETMLVSLALLSVLAAVVIVYVRNAEKRPLSTIGISRPGLGRFASGYSVGLALFLLAVLPEFAAGSASYGGILPVALLFILGYAVQAAVEEIFFRGYLLSSLTVKTGVLPAVLISSALFAGMRAWNHGASGLMIPQLFLAGAMYALLTLRTGSVWAAAGINAAQSFTYGLLSPVVMGSLKTDYSALRLSGGGAAGDVYPLVSMAACAVIIVFVLFGGENRLAVPLSDERRMYLEARRAVRDGLTARGSDGVPLKKLGLTAAASVQGDEAKAAALLYALRLGGAGLPDESCGADVLGTVESLLTGKGVLKNQTALEIRYAYEKSRGALKERYKKYARQTEQLYCPLLRRETDEAGCAETVAAIDGGDRAGAFGMMDYKVCLNCSRR